MITVDTGERLRPATLSDDQDIYEALSDWPTPENRPSLSEVAQTIRSSVEAFDPAMLQQDPIPFIRFAITVMEDAASDFVGLCEWTYHPGPFSGFDIHRIAIHPGKRGQGHFPTFSDGIAYLANQVLKAEGARYQVFNDNATMATMRAHMGGAVAKDRFPDQPAKVDAVQLERTTVENRLFAGPSRFTLRIA